MRTLPYGTDAVLLEVDDNTADNNAALRLHETLRAADGVLETVPAARTVLVVFDPNRTNAQRIETAALDQDRLADALGSRAGETVVVDVRYDGADLGATAAELGMSADALVELHTGGEYVVAFCGFSPGFAYLTGLPARLHVPRLATPRTSVPAGSVAIAGEFSGIYPRESPGGWRLLGMTDAPIWNPLRAHPALLEPGTTVRFRAT